MREALSQPSLSMAQNDVVSVEIRFLLLRLLVEISLRITWAWEHQEKQTGEKNGANAPGASKNRVGNKKLSQKHEE